VTLSFMVRCALLGSIPTTSGSVRGSGRNSPGLLGKAFRAVKLQANFREVMPTIRMAGWGV
jgi:hypothetical protein